MIRLKSLQQRFALYMLLPVSVLLFSMGIVGFSYACASLLALRREAAVLKLQRAAHHVDMRLQRPKEWLNIYHNTAGQPYAAHIQKSVIAQLKKIEGDARVNLTWVGETPRRDMHPDRDRPAGRPP